MIAFVASLLVAQVNAAQPVAQPPSGCVEEVHGAFDFWVGEWDVFPNGQETQVARSLIERLYGGCAIRENWMPFRGTGGGSLTSLDPGTGRWHQTWTGSTPGRVEFEGGPVSGGMVLTGYWPGVGGPGRDGLVRMTYSALDDGSVRQFGQVSYDHGLNWESSFDFVYRRRDPAGD